MNKVALLTGANGFIGSSLIRSLLNSNYMIYAIDSSFSEEILNYNDNRLVLIKNYFKDSIIKIEEIIKSKNIDSIFFFHFAGISNMSLCKDNPKLAIDVNVGLTADIAQFCIKNNINKIIFPSTAYVYGNRTNNSPLKENDEIFPTDLYSLSKSFSEKILYHYSSTNNLQVTILRLSNIIGLPLKESTVLYDIYKQILNFKNEIKIQNGYPIRDFIYIDDVVKAIEITSEKEESSMYNIYNISSGEGISIYDLTARICSINKIEKSYIQNDSNIAINDNSLICDNTKLKKLGWEKEFPIDSIIKLINNNYNLEIYES